MECLILQGKKYSEFKKTLGKYFTVFSMFLCGESFSFSLGVPIKIQNLDDQLTEDILYQEFSRFGNILNIKINETDKKTRKNCIINFQSPADAAKAIGYTNGKAMIRNKLTVTLVSQRVRSRRPSTPSLQRIGQMSYVRI